MHQKQPPMYIWREDIHLKETKCSTERNIWTKMGKEISQRQSHQVKIITKKKL